MEDRLRAFFTAYGEALASGDLHAIANAYTLPTLVLSDAGSIPVGTRGEIETAGRAAAEQYRAQGLVAARPTLSHIEPISTELTSVDIVWNYRDANGKTAIQEAYRYIVRNQADNELRIQVVIARPLM